MVLWAPRANLRHGPEVQVARQNESTLKLGLSPGIGTLGS